MHCKEDCRSCILYWRQILTSDVLGGDFLSSHEIHVLYVVRAREGEGRERGGKSSRCREDEVVQDGFIYINQIMVLYLLQSGPRRDPV